MFQITLGDFSLEKWNKNLHLEKLQKPHINIGSPSIHKQINYFVHSIQFEVKPISSDTVFSWPIQLLEHKLQ